jgi:DNA-binding XRE family transcriptional regulator
MVTYKDRIRSLRKEAGINQDNLAQVIGVSRFSVSNWETGKHPPDANELVSLSEYFDVSVDYILG